MRYDYTVVVMSTRKCVLLSVEFVFCFLCVFLLGRQKERGVLWVCKRVKTKSKRRGNPCVGSGGEGRGGGEGCSEIILLHTRYIRTRYQSHVTLRYVWFNCVVSTTGCGLGFMIAGITVLRSIGDTVSFGRDTVP